MDLLYSIISNNAAQNAPPWRQLGKVNAYDHMRCAFSFGTLYHEVTAEKMFQCVSIIQGEKSPKGKICDKITWL